MATLSNKHANVQSVVYPGFTGGLNLSVSSENLAKNELKEALNVEYSSRTGSMRVRGGLIWSSQFGNTVGDVFPISGRNGFLVRPKDDSKWDSTEYFRWNNIWPVAGSAINGSGCPSVVTWEDKDGNDCWIVACGDGLYKFSESPVPTLEKLKAPKIKRELKDTSGTVFGVMEESSKCHQVFLHNGRVGVVGDDDTIFFSAVGDCESDDAWTTKDDDTSSAQWIQVGYKDGMDITAVVQLSKDLIIFKSPVYEPDKGIIYRLVGEVPDWQIVEAARNTGTFSQRSVCVAGNDVFYATSVGIATLSNVMSYGEAKTGWPDRKVSNALVPKIESSARIYDVPVKQQLWIAPYKDSKEVWVFDYGHGGIWTTFEFPNAVKYVFGVDNRVFVFMDKSIYELNDDYEQDDLRTGKMRDIKAHMKLGTLQSGLQTLIKGIYASFDLKPSCEAVLKLGKYEFPFKYAGDVDYIYDPPNDTQCASEDDDPLFPEGGVLTSRRRCIIREWMFEPVIEITGGGCSVSNIGLEVVEV